MESEWYDCNQIYTSLSFPLHGLVGIATIMDPSANLLLTIRHTCKLQPSMEEHIYLFIYLKEDSYVNILLSHHINEMTEVTKTDGCCLSWQEFLTYRLANLLWHRIKFLTQLGLTG